MPPHTPARSRVEKQIAGALRDTINKHGPIDDKLIASAAKRVYGTLYGGNDKPVPETNGKRLPLSCWRIEGKRTIIRVGDRVEVAPSQPRKHDGFVGEVLSLFQDAGGPVAEVRHPTQSAKYIHPSRIRGRKQSK